MEKKIENKQVTKTENGKRERKKEIELVFKFCLWRAWPKISYWKCVQSFLW